MAKTTPTNPVTVAFLILATAGCSQRSYLDQWADEELAHWVAEVNARSVDSQRRYEAHTQRHQEQAAPPEDAGVDWYVDAALRSNPEIRAAQQRAERMRERVPQATRLPDPMASVTFGELAETAAGQVDYVVGVQQSIPFPGTLDARGGVAHQEVEWALHEVQAVRDRVAGDVRRAYWSLDGAVHELGVLNANRVLLLQIESSVQSRQRVGESGQDDVLRASRELAALDNRISQVERRRRTAAAMLARLTQQRVPHPWSASRDRDEFEVVANLEELARWSRLHNPDVAASRARMATYRQQLELARQERLPDFIFGVQYGAVRDGGLAPSANGDDQIAGTVGVTIPLWREADNAAEREAMRGMGEALAQTQAAQDRAAFELDEALARIEANQQSLHRLRERMMPDARQTIDVALTAYRTGDTDFLQLLEDWEALLGDQLEEARLVADLHRAWADLRQALGGSLPIEAGQHASGLTWGGWASDQEGGGSP